MFLLLIMLVSVDFEVSAEEMGVLGNGGITIHNVNSDYVLTSVLDDVVCLLSGEGDLLKRYDVVGLGPNELRFPAVLGASTDHILVRTGGLWAVFFDRNLNLQDAGFTRVERLMSKFVRNGIFETQDRYIATHHKRSPHLFELFDVEDGVFRSLGPKMKRGRFEEAFIQNRMGVVADVKRLASDSNYSIRLYYDLATALKEKPDMTLSASIENLRLYANQYRCVVSKCVRISDGFIVQILSGPPKIGEDPLTAYRYWDYYTAQGVFLKRVAKGENVLIPSKNSSDVFELQAREEDSFLVKLY